MLIPCTVQGTGDKRGILFRKREALIVRAGAEGNAARCPPLLSFPKKEELCPPLPWGRETKGVFSFAKENTPFGTPRGRPDRQPRSRRSAAPPECSCPARGVAAFHIAIRLDLLLLPASALPILFQCGRIPSYRQSHQGGERSKAAPVPRISLKRRRAQQSRPRPPHLPQKAASEAMPPMRRQSAARLPSLARYGVRAVDTGNDPQGLVAKPRTPHLSPQAAQLFEPKTANVRGRGGSPLVFLSGDLKGDTLFEKRVSPLVCQWRSAPHYLMQRQRRCNPHLPRGGSKGIPSSRREYPLFLAAAQRAARTHAAPLALQPPSPARGRQSPSPCGGKTLNPEARSCRGRRAHGSAGAARSVPPARRCWTRRGSSRCPFPW